MFWRPNSNKFTPPYDVIELSDKIIVLIEVAGMNAGDFKINLAHKRLVISGVRHRPSMNSQAHHRVEIGFGEFRLDIPLSWTVVREMVSATYRDGFLQIDLPRRAETQIQIMNVDKQQDEAADDK